MTRIGAAKRKAFQQTVLEHYRAHGRYGLPWRRDYDPYAILVSEIMLQQTQVERVVPKFEAWLKAFPTSRVLAEASVAEVLRHWQGLGYNRRALNLHKAAQALTAEHGGKLPQSEAALLALPGIGPYTAGAVRAFAFNQPVVMIETNIRSVYLHHFFLERKKVDDAELLPLIEQTLDAKNPRRWYAALMDYGAHLKSQLPNPSRRSKQHTKQSTFAGSNRQVRGAIIRVLTQNQRLSEQALIKHVKLAPDRVRKNIVELEQEGFLARTGRMVQLNSAGR